MQPAAEGTASRDDALAVARSRAIAHRAAFERLGARFDDDASETVVEWQNSWGTPLDPFVPISSSLLRAAVAYLSELEQSLDASVAELSSSDRDRRDGPDGWSMRMVIDHIAQGYILFMERLEPWPLVPEEAQAAALEELLERVALHDRGAATAFFGWNDENRRVRWTPRKILRVVGARQREWLDHAAGGPRPRVSGGHDEVAGDEGAIDEDQVATIRRQEAELRRIAREHPAVREMAWWYRYYRDRLAAWPADELDRWRATSAAFSDMLLAMDELDLARIRMSPSGACTSVRQQLSVALAHIAEHAAQIAQIRGTVPA